MHARVLLFVLLLFMSFPVFAQAQGSLCRIDLSSANATLTQAQAAAAAGDLERALGLIQRADQALAAIEARCDLEVVQPDVALEQTYTGQGGFSVSYPAEWVVGASANANSITLGTDEAAANAIQTAEPNLTAGQRGTLVVFGTPAEIAGGASVERTLDGVIDHFASQLATSFLVRNTDHVYVLDGRAAASLDFAGASFDGMMIVIEIVEGREYALVAGAAAKGELADFLPTLQAVAASISAQGAAQ